VIADVVLNFAITVVLSGRTKEQRVLAHSGRRTIFGWRREIWTWMMTTMMIPLDGFDYYDGY